MSQVKISGNASGTGVFTVASPNSNNTQTLTLPDATATLVGDTATQTLTNKTLTSPTLTTPTIATIKSAASGTPTVFQDSAGTETGQLCRAWVNFNGTTSPGTIRASFNVTSVTKSSTGNYSINFTNALTDANYATAVATSATTAANMFIYTNSVNRTDTANTSSICYVALKQSNDVSNDPAYVNVAIFR